MASRSYPTIQLEVRVTGYQRLKEILEKMSGQDYYRGMFRDMLKDQLEYMTMIARQVTHRLTGMLAESHTWEYDSHRMRGRVFISPRVAYARGSTVQWPFIYGRYEAARGGSHDFYRITIAAGEKRMASVGLRYLKQFVDMTWR